MTNRQFRAQKSTRAVAIAGIIVASFVGAAIIKAAGGRLAIHSGSGCDSRAVLAIKRNQFARAICTAIGSRAPPEPLACPAPPLLFEPVSDAHPPVSAESMATPCRQGPLCRDGT